MQTFSQTPPISFHINCSKHHYIQTMVANQLVPKSMAGPSQLNTPELQSLLEIYLKAITVILKH